MSEQPTPDNEPILKVWLLEDGDNRFEVSALAYEDPASWGILFADIARLIESAHRDQGHAEGDVLASIAEAFAAEVESPTS